MTHDHDHHHHHDASTYYLEQIFTIAACGALAGVFIMDWYSGKLGYFIKDKYFQLVLTGAVLLLGLVVVRAVAVWFSVEEPQLAPVGTHDPDHGDCAHGHCHDHDHGHEHAHGVTAEAHHLTATEMISGGPPVPLAAHHHGHDHDHDHGHHHHGHSHGHGHDHSHGWAPWRYVVLLLPVALYFLLPADGLSGAGQQVSANSVTGPGAVKDKGEDFGVSFVQLEQAALSEDLRTVYEGKTIRLLGKYVAQDSDHFTLVRYTMNCCAADAIPLKALTILDRSKSKEPLDSNRLNNKWVEVTGQVQFLKMRDGSSFVPAIIIQPTDTTKLTQLVKAVPPPPNPFVY